ncbi:cell division protein FtsQ/DivIB [Microlunatus sp. Gsoil 973]|uniref:cell division protein FtsQ/DivIB n=1 Tax=Microlunatus sp. Gsoil 973 TaxID=2672569 RepID=UPI0012B4695E|nr:FtsQ-type POTRA domain-containing protein [Microlunatus sp. Gsoil 973]QGN31919.1 FtsQ-type POTRA domain-containing protein [Microlunatus sp. Gsoil 973]
MAISPAEVRTDGDAEETVLLDWRRRRNRRRLVLRLAIPLLLLALVAAGIYLVGFSSVLAVRSVRITGEKYLTQEQVAQVAAVPYGAPLARTDVRAIQQRVADIRQVETAEVGRSWPNTITIAVVERKAVYAVDEGSSVLLVDRFGVGFRSAPSAGSLPKAKVPAGNRQLLKAVGIVVAALPHSLQQKVDRIEANSRDSITLRLADGDVVFWGSEEQSALKATVLVPLLKEHGSRYDVSAPGNPAIR